MKGINGLLNPLGLERCPGEILSCQKSAFAMELSKNALPVLHVPDSNSYALKYRNAALSFIVWEKKKLPNHLETQRIHNRDENAVSRQMNLSGQKFLVSQFPTDEPGWYNIFISWDMIGNRQF